MAKKLIPFWLMPGHWGLSGKTRAIAKAEYELKGYDLDSRIVELTHEDDEERREKELLKVKKKHKRIDPYDYDLQMAERTLTGIPLEVRKIEIQVEHGKIDEQQGAKFIATAKGEPYIAIVSSDYMPSNTLDGPEFEFDWNHIWIEKLINAGYNGHSEDQIIASWFRDVCRSVMLEGAEDQPIPFNSRRTANRMPRDGGPTDYS